MMSLSERTRMLNAAVDMQVSAAFNLLIQNSMQDDKDALMKFVRYVQLVDRTRDIAMRALEPKI
jgi:hypothetical protein